MSIVNAEVLKKWEPVLNEESAGVITDPVRRAVTAQLLENTDKAFSDGLFESVSNGLQEAAPSTNTGNVANYDPVLISMLRRTAPKLIGYEIMGVQAMTGPTGQIFAMRSRYNDKDGDEAFYNEANTGFSTITGGNTEIVGDASLNLGSTPTGNAETYNAAGGMSLEQGEALGTSGNADFAEMSVSIEQISTKADTRKLKAEYTHEFAQDLKAIHGLEAEKELANVLSTELVAEINRQLVRSVYVTAVSGAQTGTTTAGTFDLDTDSNGRWMGEKFAGLHFFIDTECNAIAKSTRRGKGNILVTSSNVASALQMAGVLKYNEAAANLTIDDTGVTYAGTINNKIKVFIDPYATSDYIVNGYKGANSWDAGMYYCPYTPLQMVKATNTGSLTPVVGFQTRYGLVANPFSKGATASDGTLEANSNVYYRRTNVSNII
jgi:hypothetical protein